MTGLKRKATSSPDTADKRGWAPRLAQEHRLRQLDELLARHPVTGDAVATEVERAVLLGALDRRQEAQQAFVAILQRAPTDEEIERCLMLLGQVHHHGEQP